MIVPLDDFGLVLGIDFLTTAKTAVMLHLGEMLLIEESGSFFVAGFRKEKKEKEALLPAIQGDPTYLAALLKLKPDKNRVPLIALLKDHPWH